MSVTYWFVDDPATGHYSYDGACHIVPWIFPGAYRGNGPTPSPSGRTPALCGPQRSGLADQSRRLDAGKPRLRVVLRRVPGDTHRAENRAALVADEKAAGPPG